MSLSLNFQNLLSAVQAQRGSLSLEDVNRRELEAFNQLHEGNVDEALNLYNAVIRDLEAQLRRRSGRGSRSDDAQLANSLEEGRSEADELERKLVGLKDQVLVIQLAREMNPGMEWNGAQADMLALERNGTEFNQSEDELDRIKVLESYVRQLDYFQKMSVPFHIITLAFGTYSIFRGAPPCTAELAIVYFTFYIFFPFNAFSAILISNRLREIDRSPDGLGHISSEDWLQTLWPKNTWRHKFDVVMSLFNLLGRIAWIACAMVYLIQLPEDCDAAPIDTLVYVLLFLGNINLWAIVGFCGLAITSCLFCCPCLSYMVLSIYREHMKTKPVGMKKKDIKALPSQKYVKGMVENDEEPICTICLEEFTESDVVRQVICPGKHVFHEACLDPWLKINDTCPLCNYHFTAKGRKKAEREREEDNR